MGRGITINYRIITNYKLMFNAKSIISMAVFLEWIEDTTPLFLFMQYIIIFSINICLTKHMKEQECHRQKSADSKSKAIKYSSRSF